VEVVNLRVTATGTTSKPTLPRLPPGEAAAPEPARVAQAQFGGKRMSTAFYRWEDLPSNSVGSGPAVIAGGQATAVIPPGARFRIDGFGNLIAVRAGAPARPRLTEQATVSA
jgi:N-methylhydantoinase A/oxoprolinase/acetone carboxylase beta subunit